MWTPEATSVAGGFSGQLNPDHVLYEYDGPQLFLTRMGVFLALVYKIDEGENTDLYLISEARPKAIEALLAGAVSLRAALDASAYWLVETSPNRVVIRSWHVDRRDLPADFLPEEGVGIVPSQVRLPDTLGQLASFFSVRFTGPALNYGQLPFRLFQDLSNKVFSATNKLFVPEALKAFRLKDIFDWPLEEPQFGSLLLSVSEPIIDLEALSRRASRRENYTPEDYISAVHGRREFFFERATEVVEDAASRGSVRESVASENLSILETVTNLAPTEHSGVDVTEFNGRGLAHGHVVLDEQISERLLAAYASAVKRPRRVRGLIELLNLKAGTIVVRDAFTDRPYTVYLGGERYARYNSSGDLRSGRLVSIYGDVQKRTYRDQLWPLDEVEFIPPEVSLI